MTISETKVRIRHARTVIRQWQEAFNTLTRGRGVASCPKGLNLSQADFDAMEWGLCHLLKAWIYEIDNEGEIIPGTGKLTRVHGGYTRNDGTPNFMFKGITVRFAEPVGFV